MFRSLPDIPFHEIRLDELPKHSPWPARLLGDAPFVASQKTRDEIQREFGRDKWGTLLARALSDRAGVSIRAVEGWERGTEPESLCSFGDRIGFAPSEEAGSHAIAVIAAVLRSYYPADALVELGAGYGHKVLSLAKLEPFSGAPLIAGEITQSGRDLMMLIASASGLSVRSVACDLGSATITNAQIPPGAVLFTSYAAHYVPDSIDSMLRGLANLHPKMVVHFEPLYEHHDRHSLLGLLRRRYIEANGYNKNLLTSIQEFASSGSAEIVDELPSVFGLNPLLPFSVVSWRPIAA